MLWTRGKNVWVYSSFNYYFTFIKQSNKVNAVVRWAKHKRYALCSMPRFEKKVKNCVTITTEVETFLAQHQR